jgi:hypothetical protein
MRVKGTHRTHASLAELASRQHGVVSVRQLTGPLGYSESAVGRAVAAGRLHRLYRGVFAVGHRRLSPQAECLAAVLACGPGALLSHYSAGWLWGISRPRPAPFHVSTPTHRRRRPPLILHHARGLAAEDRALEDGIPVTSVARTLLDLAGAVDRKWLPRIVERSEELGLFDLGAVESVLDRNRGHRGAAALRRAIAIYQPSSFTRSGLEREFLALVQRAGLPQPRMNHVEAGFELDAYWPEERFVVELDAYETHGGHEAFERDRLRQEDLLLVGVGMTRVTGHRLAREPEKVVERIAEFLQRRGHAGGGGADQLDSAAE